MIFLEYISKIEAYLFLTVVFIVQYGKYTPPPKKKKKKKRLKIKIKYFLIYNRMKHKPGFQL